MRGYEASNYDLVALCNDATIFMFMSYIDQHPGLKLSSPVPGTTGYKLPPYNEWLEIRKTFEKLNIRP